MRTYKVGKRWYVDITLPGRGRIRQVGGATKREAEQHLARLQLEHSIVAEDETRPGQRITAIRLKPLVAEFLDEGRAYGKRSVDRDELALRHVVDFLGSPPVAQIRPKDIEDYKRHRCKSVSHRTVNLELSVLRHLLNRAIAWDYLVENPMRKVDFLKVPARDTRFLSAEEVQRLRLACPPHFLPVVELALNTGMRRGEILGLNWGDVDFGRKSIRLRETKNGSVRYVPMNERVQEVLADLRRRTKGSAVFLTALGKRHPLKDFRTVWESTLRRAGLPHTRFHDLRHTAASHMVMAGVPLVVVKEILGHKSFAMTLRYAHLSQEARMDGVQALHRALS